MNAAEPAFTQILLDCFSNKIGRRLWITRFSSGCFNLVVCNADLPRPRLGLFIEYGALMHSRKRASAMEITQDRGNLEL